MTSILTRRSHRTPATSRRGARGTRTSNGRKVATVQRRSPLYLLLLVAVVALCLIGVVMVLSASSVTALQDHDNTWYFFKRQLIWMGVGVAALLVTSRLPYRYWNQLAAPLLGLSFVLLVLVLIPGVGRNLNGSSRWIGVGGFSFQPSELVKFALVVYVAEILSRTDRHPTDLHRTLKPVLGVFVTAAVLLILEPDLGTTIICGVVLFAMLLAAGASYFHLGVMGSAGALAVIAASASSQYRRNRVLAFIDPWDDPLNTGYQNLQSLVAIANGGLTGVGLGASRGKWGFLPYAHNDFIFAILAEEMGLVGGGFVVLTFMAIGVAGFAVASRIRDRFASLLAVGITTWIVAQAFVNIGAVIGALPITGVTLPFISLGGTSLVITLGAVGVVLNIARES